MVKRSSLVVLLAGAAVCVAGLVMAQPAGKPVARAFKPVQPLEKMMEGQKKLYGEIKEGILDESFGPAAESAWILAEMANVNHYQKEDSAYQSFADRMSADCVSLAKALEKKDASAAKDLVTRIGKTCGACHDQFQKKS
jgi:hypothetical protein